MVKNALQLPLASGPVTIYGFLFLLVAGFCTVADAQRATSLSEVRKVYVDTFSGGIHAAHLRDSLVRQLSRSSRFQIVPSPKDAEAIVTGTGQIWVRGFISINPRTPSTDRQAVFGGYLSLEVSGSDGQPLWSWLATPSKYSWTNFVDNLAGQAARKLLEAGETPATSTPSATPTGTLAQAHVEGAGATFPAPLYRKWFEDFERLHPGVTIRYAPVGSQSGMEMLTGGKLDFAGSDVAPEVAANAPSTSQVRPIATVLGAVVPIYNLKGVTQDLRFTGETLANIYLGRIRRWNDPEIRRSNRGIDLPDAEINVVHRSDGSGTAWIWSDFLSKVSPEWSTRVGRGTTLRWPVGTGAERNEGMAEAVQNAPNSIGYVELAYAIQHQISFGAVRNRSGEFIKADLDSLAEAAKASGIAGEPAASITDSTGKLAYPITAYTWIVVPAHMADPAKKALLNGLLRWVLTSGQKECSALGYVPLPRSLADNQIRRLESPQ
jgi:phosphate transport system substrate-binding protein